MPTSIKQIEDLSLNAWPSHKMELYDGWILRFSYFYTHRTNSVEQFGEESLPWSEKIPFCEKEYQRLGSPAIFKISPLVSPNFDFMLENRGYRIEHVTNVMTLDLSKAANLSPFPQVTFLDGIPAAWVQALFSLKQVTDPTHIQVVPSMYQAIPKETVCACVMKNGKIAATGLGILDRDFIGIYAIHVREDLRKKGLARQIVSGLISTGQKKGADKAYLQVVEGNVPARNLYESLGFIDYYQYWFRVQPVGSRKMQHPVGGLLST
ncbi:MAG: GNAT family N-acetyltransferase [Blautia sp.]|nr:GNAT family N-acetyltransferase [Blautia sp.]